jgi:uncharacterized membrane protein YdjX (TVP38/TMEM64 family)
MRRLVKVKVAIAAVFALIILGGAVLAGAGVANLAGSAQAALQWAQAAKGIGWVIFAFLQILIVTSGLLPASLAGMAAGAVYGIPLGFGLAAVSTMAGAVLTLALSRSQARAWVERLMIGRPRLQNLDLMLARDGARLVCLLRLSPVMPFAATSYALGLSSVSVRDYILGTTASLPALLGYVVLGRLAGAGLAAGQAGWVHWAMLAVGGLATIGLTLELGRLILRAGLVPPSIVDTVNRLSSRA